MSEKNTAEKKKSRFDRSDLISIIALLTSMAALGATLYEANILKDQQEIMQVQQKSSVWPYIDRTQESVWSDDHTSVTITASIINKGIGPALLKEITPTVKGEKIDLKTGLQSVLPDDTPFSTVLLNPSGVLAPGESKPWAIIRIKKLKDKFALLSGISLDSEICYCSIYNDCWLRNGKNDPIPSDCSSE